MERKCLAEVYHGRPESADNLQPGREEVVVFCEEGGQGVSIVRSVLLCLAQAVNQYNGQTAGDLPLLLQRPQGLQHTRNQSPARVAVAVVNVELCDEGSSIRLQWWSQIFHL